MQDMTIENLYFREISDKNEWDENIKSLPTSSTYSSWSWGEYKQRAGWDVSRITILSKEKDGLVGCFQLQKQRKFKFISILFVQGGIHLKQLTDAHYHEVLESFMETYVKGKKNTIVVINHQSGSSQDTELGLLRAGFSPILDSTSYTYLLDNINNSISGKALSKNWAHNLKRALNNKLLTNEWITDPDARKRAFNDLENFYAGLLTRKQFSTAINFEYARDIIIDDLNFKMIQAKLEGKVVAVRIGYYANDHALDFLAASGEAAKNTYANYLLLKKLIEKADEEGKVYFDCGGINPAGNIGVYNFKKGLGGRIAINGPVWINGSGHWIKKIGRMMFSLNN
jgi:hypothetical protein